MYHAGFHHLTPAEALDYVRCRGFLPNGGYHRERDQQQFIHLKAGYFRMPIAEAFVFSGGGVPISTWIFTPKGIGRIGWSR